MQKVEEQEFNKQFDMALWKKVFKIAAPYLKYICLLGIMMIYLGAVDAVYPLITKKIIDKYVVAGIKEGYWLYCLGIVALTVSQALAVKFMFINTGKADCGICYDLREMAFNRLQELPMSYFDRTPVGWIMARLQSDIGRISSVMTWNLIDLVWSVTMMFIMMVLMLVVNWKLALIVISIVPVLVAVSLYFQKRILANSRKVRKINSHIISSFNEGITGEKTIKTLVKEEESLNEFAMKTGEYRDYAVKAARLSSIYTPVIVMLGSIATGMVLWAGGNGVRMNSVSYGTLVAFISYTVQFFDPVKQFARIFNELQYSQASAERVISLIETEPEIFDTEEVIEKFGSILEPKKETWPTLHGDISFKDVSFSYTDREAVLENFNLEVKAGEKIALVGETGSGKTTIVSLLCRFYEPSEGEILIDGVDYHKRPLLWLYSSLGYVLQEPYLFSGTVRENITYGKPDAGDEEVYQAARLVNAHDFIMNLEKGYDTEVGERGNKLSTGQKQLISFARAILTNPKIFVLDEATSSVDTQTEYMIQEAINKVLEGRTSFIIAHRLSTIRSADRILVIEKGRVIEEGSHKQLLAKKGHYYSLYTNQFMEEKILREEMAGQ